MLIYTTSVYFAIRTFNRINIMDKMNNMVDELIEAKDEYIKLLEAEIKQLEIKLKQAKKIKVK